MTQTALQHRPGYPVRPRHRRFGWADLFGPLAIATLIIPVCMWQVDQGLLSLTAFDSAVGSLGLLTGLLSADLMLLQVFMLARIPQIELAWGHDLLARRHRLFGLWSFWLLVAHIAAYVIQRSTRAGGVTASAMINLFITEPWMLWATIGTLMIIGVVITSIRLARRTLRYESWHLLHLYAYLGMAFALPHMIADGADFHSLLAQIYWWSIYGLALVTVVAFRIALPLWRSWRHDLRVSSVTKEAPGVVSVAMSGRDLDGLRTRSGQFFIWRFLDGPGWTRGNPYTISDAPRNDRLRVTIQAAGDGSARAARLTAGTRVLVEGAYGTMTAERRRFPKVLFVAAGVGITPIRALLEDMPYGPDEAVLIYRYTSDAHAIFVEELEQLASSRGLCVHYLPGARRFDGSWLPEGHDRNDESELKHLVPDVAERDIYVCGPPSWIVAVKKAAIEAGAKRDQVHSEDFAW